MIRSATRRNGLRSVVSAALEPLESRQLFAVTIVSAIPDQEARPTTTNSVFPLSTVFATDNLNSVSGTVVTFPVEYGLGTARVKTAINMVLYSSTPLTTQNFLNYVTSSRYDNTIVDDVSTSPSYIRSGTVTVDNVAVTTNAAVPSEFSLSPRDSAGKVNTRGTVAMYHPDGEPNAATSQWFINLTDNSQLLDEQGNGYTVFGQVFSGSLAVADAIAALPTAAAGNFDNIPVGGDVSDGSLDDADFVEFTDPQVVSNPTTYFTYTITSSNKNVVNASEDTAGNLVLDYGTQGNATVTITATDLTGASVTDTINVTVNNPKLNVTVGTNTAVTDDQTTAVNFGTAFQGQTATRSINLKDTGTTAISLSGLTLPDGVTATQALPDAIGGGQTYQLVLTFDTSTQRTISGNVTFTTDAPNITDGSFSFPISLTVGSAVKLGTGGYKTVKYSDPDGTTVTYSLKGAGSASLAFAGTNLAVTPDAKGQNATVTGDGNAVTLSDITLTGTNGTSALSVKTAGGDSVATLGTLETTDNSSLKQAALSKVSLVGSITVPGGIADLSLLSVAAASVALGSAAPGAAVKSLKLGTVSNSNLTISGAIKALAATSLADSTLTLNGTVSKLTAASISNSTVQVNGALSSATISGAVANSSIDASSAVGKVSFGSFATSRLSSGLLDTTATPDATSDFGGGSSITSVTLKGKGADVFSGSSIFAASMGKLALGSFTTGGAASKLIAATSIASVTGKGPDGKAFKLAPVTSTTEAATALTAAGIPNTRLDMEIVSAPVV